MSIQEVYEKFKHLDKFLSNPIGDSPIYLTARDLWLAVKEAAQHPLQADWAYCPLCGEVLVTKGFCLHCERNVTPNR